jgi:HD-like signal output (HDOD) protein
MMKVLFVDDEQKVLEGLQRVLRPQRDHWEMHFALGGAAGMAEIDRMDFDVVVSDMRMPQVDGGALLRHAAERTPHTVRIALSGQADMGAMLRTVRFAHLFLNKPCEIPTLVAAIDRVRQLHDLMSDASLRTLIGGVSTLPTAPGVYTALERAVLSPDAGMDTIARIVAQDVALSAKILQLVNSSFFGLPRPSTRIEHAVSYLGITVLRALVLTHEIAEVFAGHSPTGFSIEAHESHALMVASVARRFVTDRSRAEEAFIAAILHDVGKVVLASKLPEQLAEVTALAATRGAPMHVLEAERHGGTHAEIGAYLLGLWGLPFPITEVIAHHHAPSRMAGVTADSVLITVHAANALVHEVLEGEAAGAARLDVSLLERIGADAHLPRWRTIASEVLSNAEPDVAASRA